MALKIDTAVILKVIEILPRFLPQPKPPMVDYSEIIAAIPVHKTIPLPQGIQSVTFKPIEIPHIQVPEKEMISSVKGPVRVSKSVQSLPGTPVATACLSCSRSHLATIAGGLGEAVRFARGDPQGITHPESLSRIQKAEEEINILERIDLSPEALAASPEEERAVAEEYLPRIRQLRQAIGDLSTFPELEKVAGDASILGQEFRLRHLQLKGVDLNPVVALAHKVQNGELSIEEAKAKLREIIPDDT
jgi:hypothetical protein